MHVFFLSRKMASSVKPDMMRSLCRAGCDKCYQAGESWSVFGCIDKHQCFISDTGSYRKLGERMEQLDGVGENNCAVASGSVARVRWRAEADLPGVSCSSPVLR